MLESAHKCSFQPLRIFNNDHCFFMEASKHCRKHINHTKKDFAELTISSGVFSDAIEKDRRIMGYATPSGSSQASGLRKLHNVDRTKQAVSNAAVKDTVNEESSTDRKVLRELNDADGCRDHLVQAHKCKVLLLKLRNEDEANNQKTSIACDVTDITGQEGGGVIIDDGSGGDLNVEAVQEWLRKTKSTLSANHTDLVCFAWTTKEMIKLANAFPQSLSLDATHKATKIDGLSLFTATVKDSFGKTTVILRMWIPNQKEWMFKFILMDIIPQLLGRQYCEKVRCIVTDGDMYLIKQVDAAIMALYKNAIRLPCSWHLIDRPMNDQRSKFVTKRGISPYFLEWFCRILQRWMFTWMRPSGGVYCRDEFEVSKAVLEQWLVSEALQQYFHPSSIIFIKEYVNGVLKYEEGFLACDFMDVFAFEIHSNSAHEGTNFGAKHNSNGVKANSSLGVSCENLATYDRSIFVNRSARCYQEYEKQPLWNPEWKNLTTNAASIICDQDDKTYLVTASDWVPEELTFYVICPNDIHRHSLVHEQKLKKQKLSKEGATGTISKAKATGSKATGSKKAGSKTAGSNGDCKGAKASGLKANDSNDGRPKDDGLNANGSNKATGEKATGEKADGLNADGAKADEAKAEGSKARKRKKEVQNKRITKKDISKMSKDDLFKAMNPNERTVQNASRRKLSIPEFTSCFEVRFVFGDDGCWYLQCPCKFGKRFGAPCVHEFHIAEKYLLPIGLRKWNYRDVSVVHWSIYSYLYNKDVSDMEFSEKEEFKKYLSIDASARIGTKCQIEGISSADMNWQHIVLENSYRRNGCSTCPREWSRLPASARVTNYLREEVESCLSAVASNVSKTVNSSKYVAELTQDEDNDGYELFGDELHAGVDDNTASNPPFKSMMESTNEFDHVSAAARKSDSLKDFFQVTASCNFKDPIQYSIVKKHIDAMSREIQQYNESAGNVKLNTDPNKVFFPNTMTGDNCADSISKRDRNKRK